MVGLSVARAMAEAAGAAGCCCPSEELVTQLRAEGMATEVVLGWLREEDVENREDLASAFRNGVDVMRAAPLMAEPWAWAVRTGRASWEANQDARALLSRLRKAAHAVVAPIQEALARTRRLRARRPKAKAKPRQEKDVDRDRREAAAAEAVRRSLQWRPKTGVAKGLPANDPLLQMIREIYTRRIIKFEARGVWAALKTLDEWVAYRAENSAVGSELEDLVLLTNFVEEQRAATAPLSTWNKLGWVRKHLKIELPIQEVPKPARKAGDGRRQGSRPGGRSSSGVLDGV